MSISACQSCLIYLEIRGIVMDDISEIFGISLLSEPPKCQICDRHVARVSIGNRPMHLGVECCKDCLLAWYEGCVTKDSIKSYVLEKHGELGGQGVGWPKDELPRLRAKSKVQQQIIDDLARKLQEVSQAIKGIKE